MAPSYSSTYPITGPITYGVSPADLGGVNSLPPGQQFVTVTDANGIEQFMTVTDQNGVEQLLTVYTG